MTACAMAQPAYIPLMKTTTLHGIEIGCTYLVAIGAGLAPVKVTEFPSIGGLVGIDQRNGRKVSVSLSSIERRFRGMISRG